MYGFRHEPFGGDAGFFNAYVRDACPLCGDGHIVRNGTRRDGTQKYACRSCGGYFTPATGTIFDNAKLPVTAWADFILQALSYESMASMTREDRRAETTTPYWMAKLFAVLEGIQDEAVLSGTVWLDETYRPVAAKDAVRRPDGKLPRGLSRNQICIGVTVDDSGRSYVRREGLGKTSKSKTWETFGVHIAKGSKLVHDMEGAHDILVSKLELKSVCFVKRFFRFSPPPSFVCHHVNFSDFVKGLPSRRTAYGDAAAGCYNPRAIRDFHAYSMQ